MAGHRSSPGCPLLGSFWGASLSPTSRVADKTVSLLCDLGQATLPLCVLLPLYAYAVSSTLDGNSHSCSLPGQLAGTIRVQLRVLGASALQTPAVTGDCHQGPSRGKGY